MRKFYIVGALFAVLNFAQATTINAPSGLIGKSGLDANYAYLWSVPVAAVQNSTITSATITFTGIVFKGGKGNNISVDLGSFLAPATGNLGSIKDKGAVGDAFSANVAANNAVHLGTQIITSKKTAASFTYTFTGAQLDALNSYIANGNWGFEIDPDGKFSVGGITFNYTSEINTPKPVAVVATVPDSMTTFGLLGASLLVLIVARRRVCLN
jgi:hypothetical protein